MECMIEIENLSLTMKKQIILSDINLTFEKGKIHGLIGRNGSGKTMLMKCILGFIRPSQGTIWVDHKRIGKEVDFPPLTFYISPIKSYSEASVILTISISPGTTILSV